MPASPQNTQQYFASLNATALSKELLFRIEQFDQYLKTTGRSDLWARSFSFYNQGIYSDARLNRVGEQGEYTEMFVNHFRNLLTHILNMTTNQRPVFETSARNTDFESMAQTIIGNGVLDYYNRVKSMAEIAKTGVEDCLQFADAYVYMSWDFQRGDPVMPDPKDPTGKKMIRQGDVIFKNFMPVDVIFDYMGGLRDADRQWYILRDFQNKWDLMARYPEMADKIRKYSDDTAMWKYGRMGAKGTGPDDNIPVFIFIHDRTQAVPDGRFFTFLDDDCWFIDTALPPFHKRLPVYRLCASKQRGTGFGYSVAFDLAPLQEAINGLYSTIITNQSTFGVQNILMPSGANISVTELLDGLNCISYDPKLGKPEALNLVSTPAEIFNFIQKLETVMEIISGVNSVARGQPDENLKSGSALALVQSMAIQFMSGLQQAYTTFLEDIGMGLIDILKACATTPRMVEITGKTNKMYMKSFTGKEISNINRVTVDLGNPVSRTTAGKVQIAENLIKNGMVEDAQQYIQVLTTGRLEPVIEGKQAELMLIRSENEVLSDGQDAIATGVDNHPLHVKEHKCVISSPEARANPAVVKAVLAHIQQHIDLWKQTDPALMQMIGEEPPPAPALLPPPGQPGAPAINGAGTPTPAVMTPGNPTVKKAEGVHGPSMPTNPLTHEKANPNGGA